MYYTNGLTLNDLYPYGKTHGDAVKTGYDLPRAGLLKPINNFIGFSSVGKKAYSYQVSTWNWRQTINSFNYL